MSDHPIMEASWVVLETAARLDRSRRGGGDGNWLLVGIYRQVPQRERPRTNLRGRLLRAYAFRLL